MADWYPFYPALYRSKTTHLTVEQDGIYRRLIDHYMETRMPLMDNDVALARIAGVAPEFFMNASSIIRAFFTQKDGFLYHDFCDTQLDIQDKRSRKRSLIAEKAANSRWKKNKSNQNDKSIEQSPSNASLMHGDATGQDRTGQDIDSSLNLNLDNTDSSVGRSTSRAPKKTTKTKKSGTRLDPEWELSEEDGKWAEAQGVSQKDVLMQSEKFKNYWLAAPGSKGVKNDWSATWRNWVFNFLEYRTERKN